MARRSQVLGSAVKSLLGIDVAERLIADANIVEANLRKKLEATKSREDRAELEEQVSALAVELDTMKTKRPVSKATDGGSENERNDSEEEFKAAGGKHWQARGDRKRRQEELRREASECESRLVALAATELPLSLLDDLLDGVKRQDERERLAADVEVVRQILITRDDELLSLLAEAKAAPAILRKVKKYLSDDRQSRALTAQETASRLSLTTGTRVMLHHLRSHKLADLRREAQTLLDRRGQLDREAKDLDRALSITPEDEGIAESLKRVLAAKERITILNEEAKQLDRKIAERKGVWEKQRLSSG